MSKVVKLEQKKTILKQLADKLEAGEIEQFVLLYRDTDGQDYYVFNYKEGMLAVALAEQFKDLIKYEVWG